jgi:uncharacterized membrane protein
MEDNFKSIEDIRTIRKMMEESTRFLSLSGLSGIFAGVFAITGALIAYFLILNNGSIQQDEYFRILTEKETQILRWKLIADALCVLILSIVFSLWFSSHKAKREGKIFWSPVSKRLLISMLIPLITGGIFIIVLLLQNNMQLVVPGLLIFYGLALVNAGKFTYDEVFYLGILEIITGLVSAFFSGWGIIFWVFGFGILHIVYGVIMYRKYEA